MTIAPNLDKTGQHYMIDKELIQFIVNSGELTAKDVVLEIGYGKGALTKELVKKSKVIAVDIEEYPLKHKNLTQLQENILENIDEIRQKYTFNKIISNIPYTISEPLFRKLFKMDFDLCVLTVGKNFADLLTKKDNRIGIIANDLYDIKILKIVKPKSFSPQPRVDSAVIKIIPKKKFSL